MTSTDPREPSWSSDETRIFRKSVRQFIAKEFAPHVARWNDEGRADREAWTKAGAAGLLLADVPETFGGGGGTFAHEAVVVEELARAGIHIGFNVQSIVAQYILAYGNEGQRTRWLPRLAKGELIAAIGMSEPDAGSDLQAIKTLARRDGDHYVVNGSKTFITNGAEAGLVCLAVRTDPKVTGPKALSLVIVETEGLEGFRAGRPLEKIGRHAQATSELFFADARVPATNLLGASEGRGLFQMMDQLRYERISIGLSAVAAAERAVEITTEHAKTRKAFGKTLFDLQATRFALAECATEAHIGRVFIDRCIGELVASDLDPVTAAKAKYWLTESQFKIIDTCLQLHGGYGYMQEYEIARMWADARAQRIYAGSNEVMKELIGWSL